MATPDLLSLYELYRRMYGGLSGPPQANWNPQNHELSGVSGQYLPTGGVLGVLATPPIPGPAWMQGPMPTGVGFRSLPPTPRFGAGRGIQIPSGPGSVLEIPDPHLERLVPGWMRDLWAAGTLLPRLQASGGAQESDASALSRPPLPKLEDRSGGLGWYVGPPVLEDERKRASPSAGRAQEFDPNYRILERVDDEAEKEKEIESPPLAPKDPADTVSDEGCEEEWADARRDCAAGFLGPRGKDMYSIPKGPRGRNYTIEDCARGVVSKRCGGNPLREGLSGEEAAKRNNDAVQKKRRDSGSK